MGALSQGKHPWKAPAGRPRIVAIGGTTRLGSSTEKALLMITAKLEHYGAYTEAFLGPELAELPMYAPEHPERTELAKRLVGAVRQADGLVIASPGYHGSLSGLVKNALDYMEDLSQDERPYWQDRAVGCVATGAGWQGAVNALNALRDITHALRGWPTPLGLPINTLEMRFEPDGTTQNERLSKQIAMVAQQVVDASSRVAAYAAATPRD